MGRGLWRSLRTHIAVLALVTCIFLAIAVGSFSSFLRNNQRTVLSEAQRHLALVATELARAYTSQAEHGTSLHTVTRPQKKPKPKPPPGSLPVPPPPPSSPPPDALSLLTTAVLAKEDGIEGGFMAHAGFLLGYAFPTHEGPGGRKEMPQRERPVIEELARKAVATGAAQSYTYEGSHDVILFTAQPVHDPTNAEAQTAGAVWLMQRLPDVNGGRNRQLLFASLGFGAAALATALLAWFVTVEVSGGVVAVTERLASLRANLVPASAPARKPLLAEFERVLEGVDAMALSLRERIDKERSLEEQLRHKERLSALGQFAAGVAHELRNPLATIRLRAQMSGHASTDQTVARNCDVILEEIDRLDSMIGRLLQFSRPISLSLQPLRVDELCAFVVQSWESRVPAGLALVCDNETDATILADRSRLLQVLDNLIENALQASTRDEVCLQSFERDGLVHIDVIDRGAGFSPEALRHAFDPFFTTKETGTGLGLSIAFELVTAHGGELTAASRPGGGAIVSILLPTTGGHPEGEA